MSVLAETISRAQSWAELDPNEVSSKYVSKLVDACCRKNEKSELKELTDLFPADKRISFGTAGLRSTMKPGPLGMNDLVVLQTAQGLAKYCLKQNDASGRRLCAVVGYDHRENKSLQLSSLSFALLTAQVFREAGMDCLLLDGFIATPLVPYCLGQIPDAVVGVMITASHNPKQDAGYKVYWNDGCQIRSPIDKGIADSILENLDPWIDYRATLQKRRKEYPNDSCLGLSSPEETKSYIEKYFKDIKASGLCTGQAKLLREDGWVKPEFCYTAMHGVGHRFAKASFESFGLTAFHSVPDQEKPDPSFPTVAFPNPEEKGALNVAKAYAASQFSTDTPVVLIANDPDADRLAVAERVQGDWTVFTGDQIGVMLGHWLFTQMKDDAKDPRPISMCASTVSSQMLRQIAQMEGFHFEDTLTGFKWIGARSAQLNASGYRNLFCYEEAIGFCCGNIIFDKDGVTAAAVLGELTLFVYRQGKTLSKHMQDLYDKYGEFVSNNGYYFLQDMSVIPALMDHMTDSGKFERQTVGGQYEIESIRYLGEPGYDSTEPGGKPTLPTSSSSPMITFRFTNGCVAQFRASGTEPKFKYYIEMRGKPGVARSAVAEELERMSNVLLEDLVQPSRFGLSNP